MKMEGSGIILFKTYAIVQKFDITTRHLLSITEITGRRMRIMNLSVRVHLCQELHNFTN